MAAKIQSKLSLIDIVTRADAGVIREALEARIKIDDLLVIRDEAYKKIFEIESEVEGIIGEEGAFDFGDAPYPVAGMAKKKPRPKPKSVDEVDSNIEEPKSEDESEDESETAEKKPSKNKK